MKSLKLAILGVALGTGFLACGDESTGPSGPDYKDKELTEARLLDKGGVYVADAAAASFKDSLGVSSVSMYQPTSTESLTLKFQRTIAGKDTSRLLSLNLNLVSGAFTCVGKWSLGADGKLSLNWNQPSVETPWCPVSGAVGTGLVSAQALALQIPLLRLTQSSESMIVFTRK